jgi:dsDNA-binding SOS-regulon protein
MSSEHYQKLKSALGTVGCFNQFKKEYAGCRDAPHLVVVQCTTFGEQFRFYVIKTVQSSRGADQFYDKALESLKTVCDVIKSEATIKEHAGLYDALHHLVLSYRAYFETVFMNKAPPAINIAHIVSWAEQHMKNLAPAFIENVEEMSRAWGFYIGRIMEVALMASDVATSAEVAKAAARFSERVKLLGEHLAQFLATKHFLVDVEKKALDLAEKATKVVETTAALIAEQQREQVALMEAPPLSSIVAVTEETDIEQNIVDIAAEGEKQLKQIDAEVQQLKASIPQDSPEATKVTEELEVVHKLAIDIVAVLSTLETKEEELIEMQQDAAAALEESPALSPENAAIVENAEELTQNALAEIEEVKRILHEDAEALEREQVVLSAEIQQESAPSESTSEEDQALKTIIGQDPTKWAIQNIMDQRIDRTQLINRMAVALCSIDRFPRFFRKKREDKRLERYTRLLIEENCGIIASLLKSDSSMAKFFLDRVTTPERRDDLFIFPSDATFAASLPRAVVSLIRDPVKGVSLRREIIESCSFLGTTLDSIGGDKQPLTTPSNNVPNFNGSVILYKYRDQTGQLFPEFKKRGKWYNVNEEEIGSTVPGDLLSSRPPELVRQRSIDAAIVDNAGQIAVTNTFLPLHRVIETLVAAGELDEFFSDYAFFYFWADSVPDVSRMAVLCVEDKILRRYARRVFFDKEQCAALTMLFDDNADAVKTIIDMHTLPTRFVGLEGPGELDVRPIERYRNAYQTAQLIANTLTTASLGLSYIPTAAAFKSRFGTRYSANQLKDIFGGKIQKIVIDIGASAPIGDSSNIGLHTVGWINLWYNWMSADDASSIYAKFLVPESRLLEKPSLLEPLPQEGEEEDLLSTFKESHSSEFNPASPRRGPLLLATRSDVGAMPPLEPLPAVSAMPALENIPVAREMPALVPIGMPALESIPATSCGMPPLEDSPLYEFSTSTDESVDALWSTRIKTRHMDKSPKWLSQHPTERAEELEDLNKYFSTAEGRAARDRRKAAIERLPITGTTNESVSGFFSSGGERALPTPHGNLPMREIAKNKEWTDKEIAAYKAIMAHPRPNSYDRLRSEQRMNLLIQERERFERLQRKRGLPVSQSVNDGPPPLVPATDEAVGCGLEGHAQLTTEVTLARGLATPLPSGEYTIFIASDKDLAPVISKLHRKHSGEYLSHCTVREGKFCEKTIKEKHRLTTVGGDVIIITSDPAGVLYAEMTPAASTAEGLRIKSAGKVKIVHTNQEWSEGGWVHILDAPLFFVEGI